MFDNITLVKNLPKRLFLIIVFFGLVYPSYAQYEQYYDEVPNINQCKTGVLKQSEKDKVLQMINKIRSIHKLPPVVYDNSFDKKAADVSLIIVANYADHGFSLQNHTPPQSWHCWTQDGLDGGKSSDLFFSSGSPNSETSVYSWLNDRGVNNLGHRRWMLDPFVKKIAFGRVDGVPINGKNTISGMAFYYDSKDEGNANSMPIDFIAFPYGDYPPSFYDQGWSVMSFTVIADRNSRWGNKDKVVFKSTKDGKLINQVYVEIEDEKGNVTKYTPDVPGQVGWDYSGYGIPNCLIWQVTGLQEKKVYKVRVKDVLVNGQKRDFSYQFAFRDPFISKPGVAILSIPANNAKDVNPNITLQWSAAQGADTYILQISTSMNFDSDLFYTKENINTNSYSLSGVLDPQEKYYWRIAGVNDAGQGDWSDIWNFTTTTAPNPPSLAGPSNNSTNISLTPELSWNKADKADSYDLQLSDNDLFNNIIVDKKKITETTYTIESDILTTETEYFWRVRSVSNVSGPSKWSDVWSFTTAAAAPAKPNLKYPKQGAKNMSATLELQWSAVAGAVSYDLQLSTSNLYNDWEIAVDETGITKTKYKVPAGKLELNTQYFWHVRAIGPGGKSDWSRNGRFSVGDANAVNENLPNLTFVNVYPNPTNDNTTIHINIEHTGNYTLKIYNSLGREISNIIDGRLLEGDYFINYDVTLLKSGVYFYELFGKNVKIRGKMNIIK